MNQRFLEPYAFTEVVSKLPEEYTDWSIVNMGLRKLPHRGKGQTIGILDTGCARHHQDLAPSDITIFTAIESEFAAGDTAGHGTFIASQLVAAEDGKGVAGAIPEARLVSGRVLYGDARDYQRVHVDSSIANGLGRLIDEGCGVISMSLGGPGLSDDVHKVVQRAHDQGVIIVAAAGNEKLSGSPYASFPAAYEEVISVAAADQHGLPSWFTTAGHTSTTSPEQQPEIAVSSLEYYWGCLPYGQYGRMIGTSMAAPALAAVAVVWRESMVARGQLPEGADVTAEFRSWLRKVADDVNNNGWDRELGFGTLLLDGDELKELAYDRPAS